MLALSAAVAVALGAAESPDVSQPAPGAEVAPLWEAWVGLLGGIRPDSMSAGGSGMIGIDRKVGRIWRPEVDVGLGGYAGPTDVVTRIRIGTRIEYPREGLIPYLWIALAHQHESSLADVESNPVPDIIGLSTNGVVHNTGIEGGAGVSYDLPKRMMAPIAGRLGLRATMTQLFGSGPPRYVELLASIGACF